MLSNRLTGGSGVAYIRDIELVKMMVKWQDVLPVFEKLTKGAQVAKTFCIKRLEDSSF